MIKLWLLFLLLVSLPPATSLDSTDKKSSESVGYISYTSSPLSAIRNDEPVELSHGSPIYSSDQIMTESRQLTILRISEIGDLFVLPLSQITIEDNGHSLILSSADAYFESAPEQIRTHIDCFQNNLSGYSFSAGIQCREQSGIIFSLLNGFAQLETTARQSFTLHSSRAVSGRAVQGSFSEIEIPDRPTLTHIAKQDSAGQELAIQWDPVDMADQYLIHIFSDNLENETHFLTLHPTHRFLIDSVLEDEGEYYIRVSAIDYYGVSGLWSTTASFEFTPDVSEDVDSG
ncbi:hypothetical protein QLX67_00415 [Balneolaceae bacterium ANBcel3]|nr:hypothetical protein [Balneolaceae bacterium ANBcel3]